MENKQKLFLISDEEEEEEKEEEDNFISMISDSESENDKNESENNEQTYAPLKKKQEYVDINNIEECWWENIKEYPCEEDRCKILNCSMAPHAHKSHQRFRRNYSIDEKRMIIKYLINFDQIYNGKGLQVWEEMHSRQYLTHRSVQSLNNFFKKYLLRDIKLFKLPSHIENKFLELVT